MSSSAVLGAIDPSRFRLSRSGPTVPGAENPGAKTASRRHKRSATVVVELLGSVRTAAFSRRNQRARYAVRASTPGPPDGQSGAPRCLFWLRSSRADGSLALRSLRRSRVGTAAREEWRPDRHCLFRPAQSPATRVRDMSPGLRYRPAARCRPRSSDRTCPRPSLLPLQHEPGSLRGIHYRVRGLPDRCYHRALTL